MDWISTKLYYVERRVWDQYNTIGVLDITTSKYKVLPLNVDAPYNIIVDPTNRFNRLYYKMNCACVSIIMQMAVLER